MKKKEKFELINKYIDIHRILFLCKQSFLTCNEQNDLIRLNNLCEEIIQLKEKIEKIFVNDNAFLLLKTQLKNINTNNFPQTKTYSVDYIDNKKKLIEKRIKEIV